MGVASGSDHSFHWPPLFRPSATPAPKAQKNCWTPGVSVGVQQVLKSSCEGRVFVSNPSSRPLSFLLGGLSRSFGQDEGPEADCLPFQATNVVMDCKFFGLHQRQEISD